MASFVKTRLRCALYPSKVNEPFTNVFTGQTPKIYKGAGVDIEVALFNGPGDLFDPGNITDVTVLVRPANSDTVEILKTAAYLKEHLSMQAWNSGQGAHATISLLGSETSIAAGMHRITIWGHTSDNGSDADVFGVSTLEVIDAGITAVTNPAIVPSYLTEDQIRALLQGYVTYLMPPGKTLTFATEDGLSKRVLGITTGTDGPIRVDDIEAV